MEGGINYRVGTGAATILIIVAIIFDIFTFIPFVGWLLGPIGWGITGFYLWTKGVSLISGRKLAVSGISLLGELLPVIQAFPMLTVGVVITLIMVRIEDKTGISVTSHKKGVTPPRLERRPLNSDGVRAPRRGNIHMESPRRNTEDEEISLAE